MTYREAIQLQISALNKVYDHCGSLRDEATGPEKRFYNDSRGLLSECLGRLKQLDDEMTRARGKEVIDGDYSIIVRPGI